MVRLVIDFENTVSEWWESGGRELWEGILEGFDNHSVLVDESIADSWMATAAQIPGWHDGPEHAPHPVRIQAVDEDEML